MKKKTKIFITTIAILTLLVGTYSTTFAKTTKNPNPIHILIDPPG